MTGEIGAKILVYGLSFWMIGYAIAYRLIKKTEPGFKGNDLESIANRMAMSFVSWIYVFSWIYYTIKENKNKE